MIGTKSKSKFFRRFPALIQDYYQGHKSMTAQDLVKIMDKTEKTTQNFNPTKQLFVLIIDELGLAEQSPYNPLKSMHSYLEVEKACARKFGFVGVTTSILDAAKMKE